MNIGSRKCCDIIKSVSNHVKINRVIFQNSKKVASIQNKYFSNGKYYQNHFPKTLLVDRQINKLFARFYGDYPPHKIVTLPNLSPTMETGSVLSWGRKEGEEISEGDLLAEIETDKATMSMDASDNGILAKILVKAGTRDIPIGTPLCVIVENPSDVAAFAQFTVSASQQAKADQPSQAAKVDSPPPAAKPAAVCPPPSPASPTAPQPQMSVDQTSSSTRVFASPFARSIARERNIDLNQLSASIGGGSGPDGRIRASDLDRYSPSMAAGVSTVGSGMPFVDSALTADRSLRGERAMQSKMTAPHFYLHVDVRVDRALALRGGNTKQSASSSQKDKSLSLNDIVVKAAAVACLRVPQCNSSWMDGFIRQYNKVSVDVVVPTSSNNISTDMITINIANADSKGLKQINGEIREKIDQAAQPNKSQQLTQNQVGTFTVSNLGTFGITSFTPIITLPQACTLAVGGRQERLIFDDKSDIKFSKATYMSVTLCCDHRVVDGAVGAQWLREFKQNIEDPANMLL